MRKPKRNQVGVKDGCKNKTPENYFKKKRRGANFCPVQNEFAKTSPCVTKMFTFTLGERQNYLKTEREKNK